MSKSLIFDVAAYGLQRNSLFLPCSSPARPENGLSFSELFDSSARKLLPNSICLCPALQVKLATQPLPLTLHEKRAYFVYDSSAGHKRVTWLSV